MWKYFAQIGFGLSIPSNNYDHKALGRPAFIDPKNKPICICHTRHAVTCVTYRKT